MERPDGAVGNNTHIGSTATRKLASRVETTLGPLFAGAKSAVLLDIPEHENIGDSAIWLGALTYLTARQIPVVHTSSARLYDASRVRAHIEDGTVVVLSGGGNLGSLYPLHQRHRENVIRDLPDARIVQLPQTVHFEEPSDMQRSMELLASHPDLVVLARDLRSYDLLESSKVKTQLCPDMSHLLFSVLKASGGSFGTLVLARSDKERAHPEEPYADSWRDWPKTPRDRTAFLRKAVSAQAKLLRLPKSTQIVLWSRVWPRLARGRVERARRILKPFETVITDRLHGMLISVMLGRRVVAVDNSYGKVFGYLDTWAELDGLVGRESTISDAARAQVADLPRKAP